MLCSTACLFIFIIVQSRTSTLRMMNAVVHIQDGFSYLSETFLETPSQTHPKKGYNDALGAS